MLIFDQNINAINNSKVILSVAFNETPSFGVEAGYAYSQKKKIIFLSSATHKMSSMLEGMHVERIQVDDLDNLDEYFKILVEKLIAKST